MNDEWLRRRERIYTARVQAAAIHLQSEIRRMINVAGTGRAAAAFTGLGYSITDFRLGGGMGSRDNLFGEKGKKFRKGRRIYGANPSKPGEPPHKQWGELRRSIAFDTGRNSIGPYARVGSVLKVARFLELGTRKMAPRPFLRRALREQRAAIERIITEGRTK